jgi:hypothetical protein
MFISSAATIYTEMKETNQSECWDRVASHVLPWKTTAIKKTIAKYILKTVEVIVGYGNLRKMQKMNQKPRGGASQRTVFEAERVAGGEDG